jgi:hypothetical protein
VNSPAKPKTADLYVRRQMPGKWQSGGSFSFSDLAAKARREREHIAESVSTLLRSCGGGGGAA